MKKKVLDIFLAFIVLVYLVFLGMHALTHFGLFEILLSSPVSFIIITNLLVLVWTCVTAYFLYAFSSAFFQKIPVIYCLTAFLCGIVYYQTAHSASNIEIHTFSYTLLFLIALLIMFASLHTAPFKIVNIAVTIIAAVICYILTKDAAATLYALILGLIAGVCYPLLRNRRNAKSKFSENTDGGKYRHIWLLSSLNKDFSLFRNVTLPDKNLDREYPGKADFVIAGRGGVFSLFIPEWNGTISGEMYAPKWMLISDSGASTEVSNLLDTASLFALCLTAYIAPAAKNIRVTPLVLIAPPLQIPPYWRREHATFLMAGEFQRFMTNREPVYTEEETEMIKKMLAGMVPE